ncbi:MAG: serine hydrolase domain-containing protein, partial [Bacteroidota bacterium]
MIKHTFTISILTLLLPACTGITYHINPEAGRSPNPDPILEQIDAIIYEKMIQHQIPGLSIGIVSGGATYYTNGYGVRNMDSEEAVSDQSIFHTASISKLFTAHAIMNLVENGTLQLDDRVSKLLPNIQSEDARFSQITIAHLLSHTSGLPDISNYHWSRNDQSDDALKQYILSQNFKLKSEPGQSYRYSNLGYNLLGYIIQQVTEMAFEDYIRSSILEPLQMHDSDFRYFRIDESLRTS